jgi:hypothetical protein
LEGEGFSLVMVQWKLQGKNLLWHSLWDDYFGLQDSLDDSLGHEDHGRESLLSEVDPPSRHQLNRGLGRPRRRVRIVLAGEQKLEG